MAQFLRPDSTVDPRVATYSLFGMMTWIYTWYRPGKDVPVEEGEAEAITSYLLSFSKRAVPHDYYVFAPERKTPKPASAVERGRLVFERHGCQGCHGIGGAKGWRNFNALGPGQDSENRHSVEEMAKGVEPTLVDVAITP